MADHDAKVANEKVKGVALMLRNGGIVLFSAAVAKWYSEGLGIATAAWIAISGFMGYTGIQLLGLMQPED